MSFAEGPFWHTGSGRKNQKNVGKGEEVMWAP